MKRSAFLAGAPAIFLLAGAALPAAPLRPQTSAVSLNAKQQSNRLGNGGFESWGLGDIPQGWVPPELWYPMGDAASLPGQSSIAFSKVDAPSVPGNCALKPSGEFVARISASAPGNFVSQKLENFAEYRNRTITFSVSVMAEFSVAVPKLIVDDGVEPSEVQRTLVLNCWERMTVVHTVRPEATKLELKIEPNQTIYVDDAQLSLGALADAVFVPRPNPEPGLMEVPIGAVLDWYRFDENVPVPEGFAIADGSVITDPESPFTGRNTPNLIDRFVRGVSSVDTIGTTGGADAANVDHTHPIPHTHSGNTGTPHIGGGNPPAGFWRILMNPIPPWLLAANENHYHPFTTGGPSNAVSGSSSLASIATVPAYVGLLKIVRIK